MAARISSPNDPNAIARRSLIEKGVSGVGERSGVVVAVLVLGSGGPAVLVFVDGWKSSDSVAALVEGESVGAGDSNVISMEISVRMTDVDRTNGELVSVAQVVVAVA